jgi:PAS domain S-box-containing protein
MNKTIDELQHELSQLRSQYSKLQADYDKWMKEQKQIEEKNVATNQLWVSTFNGINDALFLFDNNPQPMWIYDIKTLAFMEVNQTAVNHYGYSKEEFLSMTLKDIRHAEEIPVLLEDVKNTIHGYNLAGEWKHLKKNGEVIIVEITSQSVISNKRQARHVLVNDITKRKQSEDEILKLSQAIEQSPCVMPGMTGYDATCEIHKFNKNVIIIAQTAYAFSGDYEKALEAGCNDYISKPIKKRILLEKIQKYL